MFVTSTTHIYVWEKGYMVDFRFILLSLLLHTKKMPKRKLNCCVWQKKNEMRVSFFLDS